MTATLHGNRFVGRVSQTISIADGSRATEMTGSLSGEKINDTANFPVRWSGLWPNATVAIKPHNLTSYSIHVSSLGFTIMDVTFKRIAKTTALERPQVRM
jgi:hypothetical protein